MSIMSYWTKRRKIRANVAKVIADIGRAETSDDDTFSNVAGFHDQKPVGLTSDVQHVNEIQSVDDCCVSDDQLFCGDMSSLREYDDDDESIYFSSENEEVVDEVKFDLSAQLSQWAIAHSVTQIALSDLLSILKPHFSDLPKDARTLLKTERTADIEPLIQSVSNGAYYHFGIENGLKFQFQKHENEMAAFGDTTFIQINIDGVPLFKSTNGQFWPILGKLDRPCPFLSDPFVIGVFYGTHKPSTLDFLSDFVHECRNLQDNGLLFNGKLFKFALSAVICDAPARAFIKNVKGHTSYNACERCTQSGTWNGKMTFPKLDAAKRTDSSFNDMEDADHHSGKSPLSDLGIGMVSQFVLDYMHLICLGVVRRFIWLWLLGPVNMHCRLNAKRIADISDNLLRLRPYIPAEFARKPRSLCEWQRWKATEFRQFLLYTGPVVLVGKISDDVYNNFIVLSVAMFVLLNKNSDALLIDYAEELLVMFVKQFAELYGANMVVFNVHNVIHLADDARKYGSLDNVSAFCFENFLGKMVKLVRKPNKPLEQLIRRMLEQNINCVNSPTVCQSSDSVPAREYHGGFVPRNFESCRQYKQITVNGALISVYSGNNCVNFGGRIALVRNILAMNNQTMFVFQMFCDVVDFFVYPTESSRFGIYKVSHLDSHMHVCRLSNFTNKMVLLPYSDCYVVFPLIHMLA